MVAAPKPKPPKIGPENNRAELQQRLEIAEAREQRALDALDRLRRVVDRKQFMTPADQAALWAADAVLAEVGR